MIKFSIITCTYNAADVLQRTLDSVLSQSYLLVEHIIIDGGSSDTTVRMAASYAEENRNRNAGHDVMVISEHDNGLYDAMNKGIQKAGGTYLLFLNAGDIFPNNETLQDVAASIADGEALPGVIYGDTDIVDGEGHFLRHREHSAPDTLTWKSFRNGMLVCHQAFYALTDIAKITPYYLKYKFSADVDWCIRIMKESQQRGLAMRKVNQVVVNYLDGGMTTANHRASLWERFDVMCHHYGLFVTIAMHISFVFRKLRKKKN